MPSALGAKCGGRGARRELIIVTTWSDGKHLCIVASLTAKRSHVYVEHVSATSERLLNLYFRWAVCRRICLTDFSHWARPSRLTFAAGVVCQTQSVSWLISIHSCEIIIRNCINLCRLWSCDQERVLSMENRHRRCVECVYTKLRWRCITLNRSSYIRV